MYSFFFHLNFLAKQKFSINRGHVKAVGHVYCAERPRFCSYGFATGDWARAVHIAFWDSVTAFSFQKDEGRFFTKFVLNKTPAQAFTPPADEKKMGTIWIFVYYAVYGSGRGRCRDFLVLKWGGGS